MVSQCGDFTEIMVQHTAEVYAIELYELPKEMPIAVISSSMIAEVSSELLILQGTSCWVGGCRLETMRSVEATT